MKRIFNLLITGSLLLVGMSIQLACKSAKPIAKAPPKVQAPSAPDLAWPENGANGEAIDLSLTWNPASGAKTYNLRVATDKDFTKIIANQNDLTTTSEKLSELDHSTTYYWQVNASNEGGTSPWSTVWSFTTVAAPAPPPPPKIELQTVHFDFDKSNIDDQAAMLLAKNVKQLKDHPQFNIMIDAYTDHIGGDQYNLRLSARRADAVTRFYTDNGIAASRITARGLGKAPVRCAQMDPAPAKGCRANRRAESHITNQLGNQ